jgi:hypothetical protein
MNIDHWSRIIGETSGDSSFSSAKISWFSTLDAAAWVAGACPRLLRGGGRLCLAVYKGDYNSTEMANCNPTLPDSSIFPLSPFPLCPTHYPLPKARFRFLYFHE